LGFSQIAFLHAPPNYGNLLFAYSISAGLALPDVLLELDDGRLFFFLNYGTTVLEMNCIGKILPKIFFGLAYILYLIY
jgi:hypothetical protein